MPLVKVDQEKMSLELCKQFSFLISRLRLDKLAIIADIFIMYILVGLSMFSRITLHRFTLMEEFFLIH